MTVYDTLLWVQRDLLPEARSSRRIPEIDWDYTEHCWAMAIMVIEEVGE